MTSKEKFGVMKDLTGYFKDGQRETMYNNANSFRDKVLIRLLWVTGRRIMEILMVKVGDIDFDLKKIAFHIEKKRIDLVKLKPIDEFTRNMLIEYIKQEGLQENHYLFKSDFKEGFPITRQRAFQIIRKVCKDSGIERVGNKLPHPHHFRHSFAIDMAKKMKTPSDVRKLQMLMDHSDLGITEQYLQFNDEEISELVEDLYDRELEK